MLPAREETFLLARFRELYTEVLHQRHLIETSGSVPEELEIDTTGAGLMSEAAAEAPEGEPASGADPAEVHHRLLGLLERHAMEAERSSDAPGPEVAEEARYAMAALADEVFLNLSWSGRRWWRANLLEARLFHTHRAGERIFERIDALLEDPERAPSDLARLYLLTLGLGFEGRFRGLEAGAEELAVYARRLHGFLAGREPELRTGARPLFPAAYASTLGEGRGARLPYLRPWLLAAAGLGALWLLAAHGLWRNLIAGLEPILRTALGAP